MTIEGMNAYLRDKGFDVIRERDTKRDCYVFTICKPGYESLSKEFKYPKSDDWNYRNLKMEEFLDGMVRDFYRNHGIDSRRSDDEILRDIRHVFDTLTPVQRDAVYKIVGEAVHERHSIPSIERVIFNNPATIIFWSDKTKTVIKCGENDWYDPEKGLAMAIAKKALGNQGNYYNVFREHLKDYVVEPESGIGLMYAIRALTNLGLKLTLSPDNEEVEEEPVPEEKPTPKPKWEIHWKYTDPIRVETFGGEERVVRHQYASKYNAERSARRNFGEPGTSRDWWIVKV